MERPGTSADPRHEPSTPPPYSIPDAFKEWLVTDQRGAFAMGTPEGVRFRKYHGFFSSVVGRGETHFLADLDICLDGAPLWPHCYRASEQAGQEPTPRSLAFVLHPEPGREGMKFRQTSVGPEWQWKHKGGTLKFSIRAHQPGGLALRWDWQAPSRAGKTPVELSIRPFFAMRALHVVGGFEWGLDRNLPNDGDGGWRARVSGGPEAEAVYLWVRGDLQWRESADWYYRFLYPEETRRGYTDTENLFSRGILSAQLNRSASFEVILAQDPHDLISIASTEGADVVSPALDFVLTRPAGILAGFPWFGEWGRDTFIALPGICLAWLKAGGDPGEVRGWAFEVLARWGEWISRSGMLPNLVEKRGSHQWESADATLWWTHAVASLWSLSLASQGGFEGLEREFGACLARAIESIQEGRHVFLRLAGNGLLEVTEPHSTWMDARVDGAAVTPRVGFLPEINALWFQARCLQLLWAGETRADSGFAELEKLGRQVLALHEDDRPNDIFIQSLPLAPSFVLKDWDTAARDLRIIIEEFWTPVGLRSLSPESPAFRAHCVGDQKQRDQAYHQGAVWGWLGGHFEMAKDRLALHASGFLKDLEVVLPAEIFSPEARRRFPVTGHIPEIFDGEEPFTPRGAPAQAWSLACLEEARARRRLKADNKLNETLAQRLPGLKPAETRRRTATPTARKSP